MHTTGISELHPVADALCEAERLHIPYHVRGIYKVVADCRVRERVVLRGIHNVGCWRDETAGLSFQRFHNVGCWRDETAGLSFQRQVLGLEKVGGGEHGRKAETTNDKLSEIQKTHDE